MAKITSVFQETKSFDCEPFDLVSNLAKWYVPMRYCCLNLAAIFLLTPFASAQNAELVKEAKEGLLQSQQAIKTIRARFVSRQTMTTPPSTTHEEGDFLRTGETERVHQEKSDGSRHDRLVQAGVVKSLISVAKHTKNNISQARIESIQEGYARSSAFSELLINHTDASAKICTYDDLLSMNQETLKAEKVRYQGKDCIKISIKPSNNTKTPSQMSFWHDINAGYWIIKCEIHSAKKPTMIATIDKIEGTAPNPTFPTHATWQFFNDNGDIYYKREFELQNIILNGPVTQAELSLPTPPTGTRLEDRIRGVRGTMNSSWSIISNAEPAIVHTLPSQSIIANDSSLGTPTQQESIGSGKILLLCSLASGIVLGLILLIRKYRSREANS